MNFSKAFTYIFDDKDWLNKLIVPLLCTLIPIIGPFVLAGYLLRVTKNVAMHEALPLPAFDFGEDLSLGIKQFVVEIVYGLPFFVLALIMGILIGVSSDRTPGLATFFGLLFGLCMFVYGAMLLLAIPVANARLALTDKVAEALNFKQVFRTFRRNPGAWLTVLGGIVLTGIIAPLGGIVLVIGAVITSAYCSLMVAHLTGQAYAVSTEGVPYTTKPLPISSYPGYTYPAQQPYYQPGQVNYPNAPVYQEPVQPAAPVPPSAPQGQNSDQIGGPDITQNLPQAAPAAENSTLPEGPQPDESQKGNPFLQE